MKKFLILLAFAVCASSAAFAAEQPKGSAQQKGHQEAKEQGYGEKFKQCLAKLNLTAEQKKSMDALSSSFKESMKSMKQEKETLEAKRAEALAKKDFVGAKSLVADISRVDATRQNSFIDYVESVSKILTDAQYSKLNEMMSAKKEKARTGGNHPGKKSAKTGA